MHETFVSRRQDGGYEASFPANMFVKRAAGHICGCGQTVHAGCHKTMLIKKLLCGYEEFGFYVHIKHVKRTFYIVNGFSVCISGSINVFTHAGAAVSLGFLL
ncbi:hypothetical protein [Thalassospira lucentensis]|uniref:hypothetical protein n=1 Tax=Thalassospira lucentensis TaxID=168935 RepID=UPI003D2E1E7C